MSRSTRYYGDWAVHDGKLVELNGVRCRLSCKVHKRVDPFSDEVISVFADPVCHNSWEYLEVKRQLGDDWATDVLDSDVEVQADILRQLAS